MMALPYLPEKEICPMFRRLERDASTPELMDLASYMASTWIVETSEWPPSSWSAYMRSIRTNNDVEGWHLRLNRQASGKSQLPFYLLVKLLHKEALLTSLQIRLVSEKKFGGSRGKSTRSCNRDCLVCGKNSTTAKGTQSSF